MKKSVAASLLAIALLLVAAAPSHAWRRHPEVRGHVVIGVGPRFVWGPPYPYWYYRHWYYPPPYYIYTPPTVVIQEPPVYIQQPAPAPTSPPPQTYWYYCPSAQAYYPNVPTCPEAWIPVAPRPQ